MARVREATFDLLRRLKMTTVFGNPGSTELPFLKGFRDAIGAGDKVPGLDVEGIDLVGVASGLGVEGEWVEEDEDLFPAFKRALNAGRPYPLDVVVDPEVPALLS